MEMSPNTLTFCMNRSDDDEFGVHQLDSKTGDFPDISGYCGQVQFDEFDNDYRSRKVHPDGEATETKSTSTLHNSFDSQDSEGVQQLVKKAEHDIDDECEVASSLYASENVECEPVDFENNGVLWLAPEPEDER